MNHRARAIRSLLALGMRLLLAGTLGFGPSVQAQAPTPDARPAAAPRRVLMIYTLHEKAPWQAGVRAGLHAHMDQLPPGSRPILHEEWLDSLRLPAPEAEAAFARMLADRYAHVRFDAVVAESEGAINLLNRHPALFPDAARFLVGTSARSGNNANARTVRLEEDPVNALQAVTAVLPDLTKVVAVVGKSPYGATVSAKLRSARLPSHVELEIWDEISYDELLERAAALPARSALLWFPMFADRTGARRLPVDTLKALLDKATAPVFTHHDVNLGLGVVGGYVLSARQGGDLIARILLGQDVPESGSGLDARAKIYAFDDRALQRWGIPDNRLPAGSTIINRVEPVWVTYRWHIAAAGLALALQSMLIVALVRNLRQRMQALHALAQERALLEERVAQRTQELSASNRQLAALSATDGLTGVANRRRFDEVLAAEWSRAARAGQSLALVMLDVDHFKKFNDHYGHQAGDECLRQVAAALRARIRRDNDLVARYGGEEFVLLYLNVDGANALKLAQAALAQITDLRMPHAQSPFGIVTASMGVAALVPQGHDNGGQLVKRADEALYAAKSQGRNQAVLAGSAPA